MSTVTTADGIDIAVHDFGGSGPDLLLAHATGFHAHVWLPVVSHLQAYFRCIAFDARGHGDSGVPTDQDWRWEGFGRDVAAVVDGAGLDRPFGAGHSCGGAALLLAEEARPGTFRGLWCYEPVIFPADEPPPPSPDNRLAIGARRRREVFASRHDAFANYSAKPPFNALAPAALRAYVDHGFTELPDGTVRLKCRREHEASTYEHGGSHRAFRDLAAVRCPVTIVTGESTDAFPAAWYRDHVKRLAHVRTDVARGLGHFGPLEDPAAIAASITESLLGR